MFQAMHREAFDKRRIFWTWHPDNFGSFFKSKIVFRSFPDSAETITAQLRRLGSGARFVYDPPVSRRRSFRIVRGDTGTSGPAAAPS